MSGMEVLFILPVVIGFGFSAFIMANANASLNRPVRELEEMREKIERGEI